MWADIGLWKRILSTETVETVNKDNEITYKDPTIYKAKIEQYFLQNDVMLNSNEYKIGNDLYKGNPNIKDFINTSLKNFNWEKYKPLSDLWVIDNSELTDMWEAIIDNINLFLDMFSNNLSKEYNKESFSIDNYIYAYWKTIVNLKGRIKLNSNLKKLVVNNGLIIDNNNSNNQSDEYYNYKKEPSSYFPIENNNNYQEIDTNPIAVLNYKNTNKAISYYEGKNLSEYQRELIRTALSDHNINIGNPTYNKISQGVAKFQQNNNLSHIDWKIESRSLIKMLWLPKNFYSKKNRPEE